MSIHKLSDRIFHVHTRDGDGTLSYGLPAGSGIIDWDAVVHALLDVGYDGFLSFEMTRYKETAPYAQQALEYLRGVVRKVEEDRA